MWRNKRTFIGVLIVYLLLNLVFVKGFSSTVDISGIKDQLTTAAGSGGASINLALVGVLFGSGNSASSEVGSLYQSLILVVITLAFVWLFRHTTTTTDKDIKIRQPFYEGMTPLVPFLLVMCVVGLQFIPMLAGFGILSTVLSNSLASTLIEQILWYGLALLLTLATFYLLSSSVFALVIVTLPDTKPMAALRSARNLVRTRRWIMMRKLFLMTILVSIGFAIVVFLSIVIIPFLAEWIFFIFSAVLVPVVVGFTYKMYRELL